MEEDMQGEMNQRKTKVEVLLLNHHKKTYNIKNP